MVTEIKRVEGKNIVVEINRVLKMGSTTEYNESAVAYTLEQINKNIESSQKVVDKWNAMKVLLQ